MKHNNETISSLFPFFDEITQPDCVKILIKLSSLCSTAGLYILDKNQLVIYWGQKMEHFTGILHQNAINKPCPANIVFHKYSQDTENHLNITLHDSLPIRLKQVIHILHKNNGDFAGGVGILQLDKTYSPPDPSEKKPYQEHMNFYGMISRSPTMQPVFQLIENAATTEVTVLVRGESGSGKELVAQAIHDLSMRNNAPFLAINCAALSSNLLESELFGHVRGAFTGAIKDHSGLFLRADGGTLFLDEVAELPIELQAKLLRVLQEKSFIPVGGSEAFQVNVRIVAATHRSLRDEVKKGRFREDLMYRLRVVPIFIPPLRDRREDINLLLWHFIRQHSTDTFRKIESIEAPAMRVLMDYQWPGNIRELQNVVEYALVVGQGTNIGLADLPPEFRETQTIVKQTKESIPLSAEEEANSIRQALHQCNGKVTAAAQVLGISRATFWRKRKLYKI